MKILLVNPPNCGRSIPEELYGIDSMKMIFRSEPLSLETLAGNLDGHEVRIVDLKAAPGSYDGVISDFKADVVGITGVTCEANTMLKLASTAKVAGAIVVAGGIHASNDPEFFNREFIDYIVIGLGKLSFRELIDSLEAGDKNAIPGVAKTNPGGSLTYIPRKFSRADLVEDKPPRYDLTSEYRPHYILEKFGLNLGLVSTAFGCPHRCAFCCIEGLTGGRYLNHDPETVIRDINLLGDMPVLRLVDANTYGNMSQSLALCRKIKEAGIKKQFLADVRSDTVVRNPEMFREWRQIGLRAVIIGFEEIDDGRLKNMSKANTAAMNTEAIAILHDIGITIVGDFIISPDYDERQFQALRDYLEKNPVDLPIPSVLTPLPGTQLYESMKAKITNHDLDFYTLTNAVVPTRLDEKAFYENYADIMKSGHRNAKI
jgi:hopanoid C-3 methylase